MALLTRRRARNSFEAWCELALEPIGQKPAAHHRLLIRELEKIGRRLVDPDVEDGSDRLMVMMPPGSAKSTYASVLFPAWIMAQRQRLQIIGASHTASLAEDFSRKVQQIVNENKRTLGYSLLNERADLWMTDNGGRYRAAGVGGPITGFRCDIALIDDPVRSREDADSDRLRDKAWGWFNADLRTRMKPDSAIVLIMCLAGDTAITMADGGLKRLDAISPGDRVLSWSGHRFIDAHVSAVVDNGCDETYLIKTSSTEVRANARHPFLVLYQNGMRWIRTKNLVPGMRIVRHATAPIEGWRAPSMGATRQPNAEACAPATTRKQNGRPDLDRLHVTPQADWLPGASGDTASSRPNSIGCLPSKAASVRFATLTVAPAGQNIGSQISSPTTTTRLARFADCSATTATGSRDELEIPTSWSVPSSTSEPDTDEVVSVTRHGVEPVYDLTVDGTHNFIANGLLTHNTRWHEDDLAGRLLDAQGDRWRVLSLPAQATDDDPLGRAPGEFLWGDDEYGYGADLAAKYDEAVQGGGMRDWWALYQQSPRPLDGSIFKVSEIRPLTELPEEEPKIVRAWDLAATAQTGTRNPDWTVGLKLAKYPDGRLVALDMVRMRGGPEEVENTIIQTAKRDGRSVTIGIPQDPGAAGKTVVLYLTRKLHGHRVIATPESGSKEERAMPIASQANVGNLSMITAKWNKDFIDELGGFPSGAKDDVVDALSRAFALLIAPPAPARFTRLPFMRR